MFLETIHTSMIISKAQEERYHSEGPLQNVSIMQHACTYRNIKIKANK